MNPYFYPHDDPSRLQRSSLPPRLQPQPFSHQPFPFALPQQQFQPYMLSYPFQPQQFSPQFSQFIPPQPPPQRSIPQSLLHDPAFSPDPRINPHFFSMNDREEIYPSSISDSLSDYAPTVPDDESDIDHSNLPPRMRLLNGSGSQISSHARSHSNPYVAVTPLHQPQSLSRSSSARVVPVAPPIAPASTASSTSSRSSSRDRKGSPDSARGATPGPTEPYASASVAAKELWQPPPPYSDYDDSDSYSSSNPHTPSGTPHSSSSHLPRDSRESVQAPPLPEKRPLVTLQPPPEVEPPVASSSNIHAPSAQLGHAPPLAQTSSVRSSVNRPPINNRNASAPELQAPPPPVDVPPRPSTVPIPAPPPEQASTVAPRPRRRASKNPSIAAAPRDLDRIDELDESDPRGFAWHHGGPYEAIAKATHPDSSTSTQKRTQPPKRKPVRPNDVAVGVVPGQIFPSFSQYQPQTAGNDVQPQPLDPSLLPPKPPAENFVGSPLQSPLMLPVQRRVAPTGPSPPTPDLYSNVHMSMMNAPYAPRNGPFPDQQGSQQRRQESPQPQRAPQRQSQFMPPPGNNAPEPSPPLPNPHSPMEYEPPRMRPSRQQTSSSSSRPASMIQPRPELPPADRVPRPDITLPPARQEQDKPAALLPRHLPKKLVMPAPLQQSMQQNQHMAPVEFLAQRHGASAPPGRPSPPASVAPQEQQVRAQAIHMNQGPKVLKKRHTTSGILPLPSLSSSGPTRPGPGPSQMQMQMQSQAQAQAQALNPAAAMFAARVRFAEPGNGKGKEETKEERKRREKEQAKREKEEAKREKERAKMGFRPEVPLQGIFSVDHVKEAEIARDRELAKVVSAKAAAGRKLSKRR